VASSQRLADWGASFHVRPLVVELNGRRQPIAPVEAQLLLAELGRLPKARHQAAEETAVAVVRGLAAACIVELDDDRRRTLLRAIEGIRAARRLPPGLARLRNMLLHSPEPVL